LVFCFSVQPHLRSLIAAQLQVRFWTPAGAVVPSASIAAKNGATGQDYTAGSSSTGNYTLANLPAGTYELSVTASGFKKYIRPNLTVQVAETVRVDATLEVGGVNETITVNDEAPLLKTESDELSHQIDYKRRKISPCSP
jgi:hypothetical protein